ncbi:hypothetical protein ACFLZJ_00120 [Nanoarchaeota archaeon]
MLNKRGQGLSTSAIVLIILAVLVLIILVLGFTTGWNNILPWLKPSNNVQNVVDNCGIACSTGSVFDYCTVMREINYEEELNINGLTSGNEYTCSQLSVHETVLGVEKCPAIQPCAEEKPKV